MIVKSKISVSEALRKIDSGDSLEGYSIDFDKIKVESLDVMKLVKNGINVPEEAVFYEDNDILDEEDEEWEVIDYDPLEKIPSKTEVQISLNKDVKIWLEEKNVKLDLLLEKLLDGFYNSQRAIDNHK